MSDIAAKLKAPFPPDVVSWRVGSTNQDKTRGMALAFIDSRDVMNRLDEVAGPFGWQSEHTVAPDGKKVTCRIGIKNPENGCWVWKSDGAGETDYEGEKGSYSDSFKRSAVAWGIGRYLYEVAPPWVAIEAAGRSFKIAEGEKAKLRALLTRQAPKEEVPYKPVPLPPAEPAPRAKVSKYELLSATGAILSDHETPDAWCRALRSVLIVPKADVDALWSMNEGVARVVSDHHPELRWKLKRGPVHPVDELKNIVHELGSVKLSDV